MKRKKLLYLREDIRIGANRHSPNAEVGLSGVKRHRAREELTNRGDQEHKKTCLYTTASFPSAPSFSSDLLSLTGYDPISLCLFLLHSAVGSIQTADCPYDRSQSCQAKPFECYSAQCSEGGVRIEDEISICVSLYLKAHCVGALFRAVCTSHSNSTSYHNLSTKRSTRERRHHYPQEM